jgi:hypothetical protein
VNIVDWALIAIFASWFIIIAIGQIPRRACVRFRQYDPTGHLFPAWNFFSPKPVQSDFEIWYRCWPKRSPDTGIDSTDPSAKWVLFTAIGERQWWHGLIHPRRRATKGYFQACNRIVSARIAKRSSQEILLSVPYLLILAKISQLSVGATATQFRIDLIRYRTGEREPQPLFLSGVHHLPETARQTASTPSVAPGYRYAHPALEHVNHLT